MEGRSRMAGEMGRRAFLGWRGVERSWLRVVRVGEVVVKARVVGVVGLGCRRRMAGLPWSGDGRWWRVRERRARSRVVEGEMALIVGGLLAAAEDDER